MKISLLFWSVILNFSLFANATAIEDVSRNWIRARFERCGKVNSAANLIHAKNPMTMNEVSKNSECANAESAGCLALMDLHMKTFVKNNYKALAIQCDLSSVDINFGYMKIYNEDLYPKGSPEAIDAEKAANSKSKTYDANISCKYKKMKYAHDKRSDEHTCWEIFDCGNAKRFTFGGQTLDGGDYLFRCAALTKDKNGCAEVSLGNCNAVSYQRRNFLEQAGQAVLGNDTPVIDVRSRK